MAFTTTGEKIFSSPRTICRSVYPDRYQRTSAHQEPPVHLREEAYSPLACTMVKPEEGRPDLSRFLDSLESRSIAPSREISSLRAEYGFEKEPVPQSCFDTALDSVIEGVSHVLGKHPLGENDSVIVNGAVELSGGVFDRLRSREWLNCWDIAAALEMTDRPVLVHLGVSIPLHRKDANGEVTPISNPFGRWRKECAMQESVQ
ncbi:hypothetical protein BKA61DRAFT_684491 [Leptodontidium sp. MPI-SDFR-AT-0119]|nr:hypothetical protein BKA61DRAFT_684491 [Leptodontidium sp. MPI-SDFR-AT-0119]